MHWGSGWSNAPQFGANNTMIHRDSSLSHHSFQEGKTGFIDELHMKSTSTLIDQ